MIEIGDTIVSREIVETFFCCDLEACHGACCIEGESGAPLLPGERTLIQETYPVVEHYIPETNRRYIEQKGLMYYDADGDLVTNIIDGGACVFTCYETNGSCRCAFEKAHTEGADTHFLKPLSCHLYPIRLTKYRTFTAVNYHRWHICEAARTKGRREGVRLYRFARRPLMRAFGEQWYRQLEKYAQEILDEKR